MLFGIFTLLVALVIEIVGAYYSVTGLAAIFSGALIPIIIMGGALEIGKVTAAVWLKLNWDRASVAYKLYLVPAVAFLMVLTSMGIFGFLSKAHSDQGLVSGDSMAKVAIYDEKIQTSKDNIATNRRALKQMDDAVEQVMGRSDDEKGADKAVAIRRGQQKERARLLAEIDMEQKKVSALSEERAPLAAEFRKVESEVGPIKYIAALLYGDNPDANVLERAVRWVIILIVAVFDPLALVLILAAQQSIRWARGQSEEVKEENTKENSSSDVNVVEKKEDPLEQVPADQPEDLTEINYELAAAAVVEEPIIDEEPKSILETHPYLLKPFSHFTDTTPIVATKEVPEVYAGNPDDFQEPWPEENRIALVNAMQAFFDKNKELADTANDEVQEVKAEIIPEPEHQDEEASVAEVAPITQPEILTLGVDVIDRPGDYITTPEPEEVYSKFPKVPETANRIKVEPVSVPETMNVNKRPSALQADNVEGNETNSSFGTKFPETASKGDTFLRVDYLPNRLFKFNGVKWIEIDKSISDAYAYDEQYILFLIEKLRSGEYDIDQLSDSEQSLVAEKLQQLTNDNT